MDVLGGYGSDSSASEQENGRTPNTNALSGLLGAAASDSSSDDDEKDPPPAESSLSSSSFKPPPTKRQKVSPTNEEESAVGAPPQFMLPHPPLSSSSSLRNNSLMIHWDVDYLHVTAKNNNNNKTKQKKEEEDNPILQSSASKESLSQKLKQLARTQRMSWADHLKSQHEFHNPHFFESVVEHFGIAAPLGSQIVHEQEVTNRSVLNNVEKELFPNTKQVE